MIGHLRVKSPLSQLGIFLGLFGVAMMLTGGLSALGMRWSGLPLGGADQLDWSQPRVVNTMKVLQAVSSITFFLLPSIAFALLVFTGKQWYFLGLRRAVNNRMYFLSALVIVLAFPFVLWLGQINEQIPLPQWLGGLENDASKQLEAFLKTDSLTGILLNVIVLAFLPAICEEICFRGVLQRIMIHIAKNVWVGIIISALLFSALHLQFQGFFPRMFLGIILGALYWYSGSIWTAVLAHFVNNAAQVIAVSYSPDYVTKNPTVPLFLALCSGLCVIAIMWAYKKLSTVTYDKVYRPNAVNGINEFLA